MGKGEQAAEDGRKRQGLVGSLVTKMLTSGRFAFAALFLAVFTGGLFYMAFLSFYLGIKEFEIGWLIFFSLLFGATAMSLRNFIMKKYSKVGM